MKCILFVLCLLSTAYAQINSVSYTAKDYSSLIGKVKDIDQSLFELHFQLYQAYVKNTNLLIEQLSGMVTNSQDRTQSFGALKRRLNWEYNGMVLHELYFSNLGGDGQLAKNSALYKQIAQDFGSYENFKKDFVSTGLMRGIGWVILYRDANDGFLHNIWVEEHDIGHLAGAEPLLVMDVWEHAYLTQFGLNRAHYIDIFFNNIDWGIVSDRYGKIECPKPLLK